jgi:mRNA interferase RelE/StbE
MGRQAQKEIVDYMNHRIAPAKNPRAFGKPLRHEQYGLWRYRVRDYRIICEIQDTRLVVLVVAAGHRSTVL